MQQQDPVITMDQVRFGYNRGAVVVDNVTAALQPGRLTALVGPNAAGKTTLMRLMLGLLKPWSGMARVNGLAVSRLSATDRARWVSYVPQRAGVRFAFTVRQVVAMGLHSAAQRDDQAVDQALTASGISDLAQRVFAELSGGQQQRVMLCRALLQASAAGRALLLDEPGSHLDLHHRHATMQRLQQAAGDGLAVLVVLHDLDLATRYADDAWVMDGGRLVSAGAWDRVLTPEILEPVYRLKLKTLDAGGDRPLLAVGSAWGDTMQAQADTQAEHTE